MMTRCQVSQPSAEEGLNPSQIKDPYRVLPALQPRAPCPPSCVLIVVQWRPGEAVLCPSCRRNYLLEAEGSVVCVCGLRVEAMVGAPHRLANVSQRLG